MPIKKVGTHQNMESINVGTLQQGITYTSDLMIDNTFLLLPKTAEMSTELINALKLWGFEQIYMEGDVSLGGDIGVSKKEEPEDELQKERIGSNVKKVLENSKNITVGNSDQARMELVHSVYEEYLNYIESVFTHYATHKEINQEELSDMVQDLCIFIKEHRRYILRVNASINAEARNFLIIHTMRTTVLGIAIGLQLHLPLSKMIELGITCILHEIGMLRLPPQLYMTSKKLNAREKAQISKHTVLGYTIIKDLNFNLAIQLGVLEHHEKENGTGYPRRISGDKISSNAKIIAVACTYEAISSPRSYKDEKSTFDALLELLQNKDHLYDSNVIKALLYTVSLYPIGTYVYLANRKIAVVIDTNPDNPKCPIVQLLTEKEKDGSPKTVQTNQPATAILRILSKKEKEDILKLINQKSSSSENAQNQNEQNDLQEQAEDVLPLSEIDEVEEIETQENPAPKAQESSFAAIEEVPENENEKITKVEEVQKPASNSNNGIEEVDISIFE